jgi:hypothetical protein
VRLGEFGNSHAEVTQEMSEMVTNRGNANQQLGETAWCGTKDTCHFTAGFILRNHQDLGERFLANVSEPHAAPVS